MMTLASLSRNTLPASTLRNNFSRLLPRVLSSAITTTTNTTNPPSSPPQSQSPHTTSTKTSNTHTPHRRRPQHARHHFERRVLPFSPPQLYDIVSNVNDYHHFVPWCTQSDVTNVIDQNILIADLAVGFRVLSEKYTSVITLDPARAVSVDVPNSALFEYLITDWKFEDVQNGTQTDLSFYVEFAFRNPLYQRVTDLFFEEVVKRMVSAFEKRCQEKHTLPSGILHRW